jgi:hypothetical protein
MYLTNFTSAYNIENVTFTTVICLLFVIKKDNKSIIFLVDNVVVKYAIRAVSMVCAMINYRQMSKQGLLLGVTEAKITA